MHFVYQFWLCVSEILAVLPNSCATSSRIVGFTLNKAEN